MGKQKPFSRLPITRNQEHFSRGMTLKDYFSQFVFQDAIVPALPGYSLNNWVLLETALTDSAVYILFLINVTIFNQESLSR